MGSSRLPGKALMDVGGRPLLDWVVHRARTVEGVDMVVVATSTHPDDLRIVSWCVENGVLFTIGPQEDVLARFVRAADAFYAHNILRVTADCPLLDPVLNSRIVDKLENTDAVYVSASTRSNGFVQEAFTNAALQLANKQAVELYDREHVVPWMIRHLRTRFIPDGGLGAGRYCVDTQEDLDRLRGLYRENLDLFELSASEIVRLDAHVSAG